MRETESPTILQMRVDDEPTFSVDMTTVEDDPGPLPNGETIASIQSVAAESAGFAITNKSVIASDTIVDGVTIAAHMGIEFKVSAPTVTPGSYWLVAKFTTSGGTPLSARLRLTVNS